VTEPLLSVEGLGLAYRTGRRRHEVVEDVSFRLAPGEVLGLAGESGSGKSTVARAAMGWLADNAEVTGTVRFAGRSLLDMPKPALRSLWGRELAYIPQEVSSGLNPARRIGRQLIEVLALHTRMGRAERRATVEAALVSVGIDPGRATLSRYPFEFSGGQQQRITIAMATLCKPRLLILDEPTTGIDATLRRETLAVLRRLLDGGAMAAIYISHDLAEVAEIADRLAILYAGRVMEEGRARDVFERPMHPYSQALLRAVPTMGADRLVTGIPGTPPPGVVHDRCSFADRCPLAVAACLAPIPMVPFPGRVVRCIAVADTAARVAALPAVPAASTAPTALLAVDRLRCDYGRGGPSVLSDVSFEVREGELVGLVGESGSGKSTMLRAIAGLHAPSGGALRLRGEPLAPRWEERSLAERRRLQLVFQHPERSLNPRRTAGQALEDAVRLFSPGLDPAGRRAAIVDLLAKVRLPEALLHRYPHQLSGGEKQRVAIARAFAAEPAILLCDEIVSALDVSVQAVVMRLIRDYVEETGAAAIFVSHDLPVVRMMSAKVLVLEGGRVCESGPTEEVFRHPAHAYTRRLVGSLPAYVAAEISV
jgi:peptide/nickel transport system ATP-binding protein